MPFLSRLSLLLLVPLAAVCAQQPPRKLGEVNVTVDSASIPVRISAGTPELQKLARDAFAAHGRYRQGDATPAYEFKFAAVTPNQVRVDITRGSAATPVASQIATGATPRQALLRAADFAVEKTNGLGLRGFFTGRIAFVSQRGGRGDVFTADLFLGEAKQLTHDNALVLTPRWSPDGGRVIFTSYFRTGAPDIYAADTATGRRETIVSLKGTNNGARYSPNGQQIAMTLSGSGAPEIYVANAQGKQIAARTRSDAAKSSPCWSPDGSQIVFAMEPGPQLYVMGSGGGAPRRLNIGYSYAAEPDWSRTNRNLIACTVRVPGGKFQIAVHNLATGTTKLASSAAFDAVEPSWLADGRHLIYTARDRTSTQLAVLDTETGRSKPLSDFGAAALQASVWTP
jgi:TolB protein